MTDERLQEIAVLCGNATDGPWEWVLEGENELSLNRDGDTMEGHVLWIRERCAACFKRGAPCMWPSLADRAFIAEARTIIPELVAALMAERVKNAPPEE